LTWKICVVRRLSEDALNWMQKARNQEQEIKNPEKANNNAPEEVSIEAEWVARRSTELERDELGEPQRCLDVAVASVRLRGVTATTHHVSHTYVRNTPYV
jgi:hypothetical protein